MTAEEWNHDFARCLGVYLAGDALEEVDARGRPVRDDDFLLLFNAHHDTIAFTLPATTARPAGWYSSQSTRALRGRRACAGGTIACRRGSYRAAGRARSRCCVQAAACPR